MTGLFTLLGVALGWYLCSKKGNVYNDIGSKVERFKTALKKQGLVSTGANTNPAYGEPFVVRPNEYELEQEQLKGKKEKGFENVKKFVKKMKK